MTAKKPQWEIVGKDRSYWFWRLPLKAHPVYQVTNTDKPPTNEAGYLGLDYLINVKNCSRKNVTGEYRLD